MSPHNKSNADQYPNPTRDDADRQKQLEDDFARETRAWAKGVAADLRAVSDLAAAMFFKMEKGRLKHGNAWPTIPVERLWVMLREHVEKGDVVDVANFCAMIYYHQNKSSEPQDPAS